MADVQAICPPPRPCLFETLLKERWRVEPVAAFLRLIRVFSWLTVSAFDVVAEQGDTVIAVTLSNDCPSPGR